MEFKIPKNPKINLGHKSDEDLKVVATATFDIETISFKAPVYKQYNPYTMSTSVIIKYCLGSEPNKYYEVSVGLNDDLLETTNEEEAFESALHTWAKEIANRHDLPSESVLKVLNAWWSESKKGVPVPSGAADSHSLNYIAKSLPGAGVSVDCPIEDCDIANTLMNVVMHLNDEHKVSRDYIADWIDELHDAGIINAEFQPWGEDKPSAGVAAKDAHGKIVGHNISLAMLDEYGDPAGISLGPFSIASSDDVALPVEHVEFDEEDFAQFKVTKNYTLGFTIKDPDAFKKLTGES